MGSRLLLPGAPQESSQTQQLPTGTMSLFSQAWQSGWSTRARSEMDCHLKVSRELEGNSQGALDRKQGAECPSLSRHAFPGPNREFRQMSTFTFMAHLPHPDLSSWELLFPSSKMFSPYLHRPHALCFPTILSLVPVGKSETMLLPRGGAMFNPKE